MATVVHQETPTIRKKIPLIGNFQKVVQGEAAALVKALDEALKRVQKGMRSKPRRVHIFGDDLFLLRMLASHSGPRSPQLTWMLPIMEDRVKKLKSKRVSTILYRAYIWI